MSEFHTAINDSGPGFGSPTPVTGLSFSQGSSWGAKALDKYKRVVLMDQRGKLELHIEEVKDLFAFPDFVLNG